MNTNTTKEIDYYGTEDNYIHLKFGHAKKRYNFTEEFISKYPVFCKEYLNYFNNDNNHNDKFKNAYQLIKYIKDFDIPVYLYFNYTDTPATVEQAIEWWSNENTIHNNLEEFKENAII